MKRFSKYMEKYIVNITLVFVVACFVTSCQNKSFTETENGIELTVNGQKKRIILLEEDIVRVSVTKENQSFKDSSLSVVLQPKKVDFSVSEGTEIVLKTSKLTLNIDKQTGQITYLKQDGNIYLKEHEQLVPELRDTTLFGESYLKVKQAFTLSDEEGIYGLGQFQNGYMNYRNKDLLLVQANKISIVPFLSSTNNYGILWDNYSKSTFHDGEDGTWFTAEVADQLDYYFVGSDNMDGVISGYRNLTGQAPMFSKKAFGFWQSKERYKSFDELHDVVQQYRDNDIPIDNIVQDWRYWGDKSQWSSMYFEPEFYANPKENIQKLHDNNVDIMVSIWPSLGKESLIYKEMEENGFLLANDHWCGGKVYDAYNPKARDIYWKHIQQGLAENGVDAYWMDGTEPEFSHTNSQQITERETLKAEKTAMGPIAKYLNTFAFATSDGLYKKHRAYTDDKRVFILTRSSWAGQQRNATLTWSGDVSANFKNLKKQISGGVNFSMAGVPYWTHDIGAFFTAGRGGFYPNGIDNLAYQELYVRWFQFGAFTPIFRSHGTQTPREVWQLKDRNPRYYEALKKVSKLRYQLMPYIYSSAWQITANDFTLMRGLAMDFAHDTQVYDIADQYLFGSSILVKPVTKTMYHDVEEMLPAITTDHLRSLNGEEGLTASYFKGEELEEFIKQTVDREVNFNWDGGGYPPGIPENYFSVRWEGTLIASESGTHTLGTYSDDGIRVWFDNKLIIDAWENRGERSKEYIAELEEGKIYDIKVEYRQHKKRARITLGWLTPSVKKEQEQRRQNKTELDKVYLPEHTGWYDLWTNKFYEGGQTVEKEYPIEVFPLFVKAGSIIPFGPEINYVNEKPDAPIELRIYAGEDASFTYYEDEGNNYNYEQGAYNTIDLKWDEAKRSLTIGDSTGSFEGYKADKTFHVILIKKEKVSEKKEVSYEGGKMEINFK